MRAVGSGRNLTVRKLHQGTTVKGISIAVATIVAVASGTVTAQSPGERTGAPAPLGQRPLLVSILRETAAAAWGIERDSILGRVSIALARARDSAAAFQIAGSITKPPTRSWIHAKLGEELAQAGELSAVRQALALTTLDHHKAWVHRALAVALAEAGDTVAALHHAERHLRGVELAQALAGIVKVQVQRGDIAGALKTAERIGTWGYKKTAKADALRAVAAAQGTAGDTVGAKQTFEKARHVARRLPASDIKGSSPQATVLESIALSQVRLGDFEGALRTIEDIDRGYFKVDGLLAVAKAQADAGERVGAVRALARAAETAGNLDEQDGRSSALQRVASTQARIGDATTALVTANAIRVARESVYVKILALSSVAIAYSFSGAKDQAATTLMDALRLAQSMEASDYRKDWALSSIALAQARMKQLTTALQTARSIAQADERQRTAARILLIEALRPDSGLTLAAALERIGDTRSITAVLAAQAAASVRRGDSTSALELAQVLGNQEPRVLTVYYEGWVRGAAGDIPRALEAARLKPDGVKANALLGVAEGFLGIAPEPALRQFLEDE